MEIKNYNEAMIAYEKVIQINPNFISAYNNLGVIHKKKGNLQKAINYYEKVIKLNPQNADAFNNLGLVYRDLKKYKDEEDSYKKAIKINDKHANAYYNLAMSNQALGNIKQAIILYGKAAKYEPANLIHYYHLTDLNKEMLDEELKNKIQKVMDTKNCTKQSLAYGHFLLSRHEAKNKNYDLEFNFLKKGHQFFFDSKQKEF